MSDRAQKSGIAAEAQQKIYSKFEVVLSLMLYFDKSDICWHIIDWNILIKIILAKSHFSLHLLTTFSTGSHKSRMKNFPLMVTSITLRLFFKTEPSSASRFYIEIPKAYFRDFNFCITILDLPTRYLLARLRKLMQALWRYLSFIV